MVSPHNFGIAKRRANAGMRIEVRTPFNGFINPEPTAFRHVVRVANPVVDSQVTISISGGAAVNSRWDKTWTQACTDACTAVGATYTPSNAAIPTNPSPPLDLTGIIRFPSTYTGEAIVIIRNMIGDNRNNGLDGTPTTQQMDVFLSNNTAGAISVPVGSNQFLDQSLTPAGSPTFRFDKTPAGAFFAEGTIFTFAVYTENFNKVAGIKRSIQFGNVGAAADRWVTAPIISLKAAIDAHPGITWTERTPVNSGKINVIWGADYDGQPLIWQSQSKEDNLTNSQSITQCDIIWGDEIIPESTPPLIRYADVISLWHIDTSQSPTTPQFQIQISPNNPIPGDTLTYTLKAETGVVGGGSCVIGQFGNATDSDFTTTLDATMASMASASAGAMTYNSTTKTITVTDAWSGSSSTTRVLSPTTTANKHALRLSSPGGGAYINTADDVAYIGGAGATRPYNYFSGVNMSGGEFGAFLINSTQSMDYYASKGFACGRFPFKWEYLQSTLNGALNTDNSTAYVNMIKYWTNTKGLYAMVDLHSFSRFNNQSLGFETGKPEPLNVVDLWVKLIDLCISSGVDMSKVGIDIMNEPGLTPPSWRRYAQSISNGIRARTNFTGMLFIEGSASSGASTWTTEGNSVEMIKFYDPAANFAFSAHQYLDRDGSGTAVTCVTNSSGRLDPFINWCKDNNKLGHIGEYGWGDRSDGTTQCAIEYPQFMQKIYSNRIVAGGPIIGHNHWGDGQFWGNYIFATYPTSFTPLTERQLMLDFTQGVFADNTPYIQNS